MSEAANIIERTISILDERGWWRGGIFRWAEVYDGNKSIENCSVCLVGALGIAMGVEPSDKHVINPSGVDDFYRIVENDTTGATAAISSCAVNINEEYKQIIKEHYLDEEENYGLYRFNDESTEEEVRQALSCALEKVS